ncbi:MAG: SRPBCC family protein [Chloroflexia bacterium]|nr:SRPBCC family protein [Chloroflexia bacterium]
MTRAQVSADIAAPMDAVWSLVGDPRRWPEWDVTYSVPEPPRHDGAGPGRTIGLTKTEADRTMHLTCEVESRPEAGELTLRCTGGNGERLDESFTVTAGKQGGSSVTRQTEYRLLGQNLGIVSDTTYAEASVQRSLEQAFARLALLVDADQDSSTPPDSHGDTDTRSEDTGTISAEESYSSGLGPDQSLPQRPEEHAPARPT